MSLFDSLAGRIPPAPRAAPGSLADSIASIPVLAALDGQQRLSLAGVSSFRSFLPGEVIVWRGQRVDLVYFVVQGQVVHEVEALRSRRLVLDESGPGTMIGLSAFIGQPLALLTARALTPVVCFACEATTFRTAVAASPVALWEMMRTLSERRLQAVEALVQAVQELM